MYTQKKKLQEVDNWYQNGYFLKSWASDNQKDSKHYYIQFL